MSQLTTDLTIDELSEICIKNNVRNWKQLSIKEILDTVEDKPEISIPQMSLEAIIEQFPIMSKNICNVDYNKLNTSLPEIFGKKLIKLNTENINKLTVPGTYYMLDLDTLDYSISSDQRENYLKKITLCEIIEKSLRTFSHNKEYILEPECIFYKKSDYCDIDKYEEYDDKNTNYETYRYIFADIE